MFTLGTVQDEINFGSSLIKNRFQAVYTLGLVQDKLNHGSRQLNTGSRQFKLNAGVNTLRLYIVIDSRRIKLWFKTN